MGTGAAMDRIEMFYSEATRLMGETKLKNMDREKRWEKAAKSAALLPDLSQLAAPLVHQPGYTPDDRRG